MIENWKLESREDSYKSMAQRGPDYEHYNEAIKSVRDAYYCTLDALADFHTSSLSESSEELGGQPFPFFEKPFSYWKKYLSDEQFKELKVKLGDVKRSLRKLIEALIMQGESVKSNSHLSYLLELDLKLNDFENPEFKSDYGSIHE